MKHNIATFLAAATGCVVLAAGAVPANAGTGSSFARVTNAINGGGTSTIIAELEKAELLVCPACADPVMALLNDDRYEVREVAAWWVGRRGALEKKVTEQSLASLASGDSIAVRNAADVLGTFRYPSAIAPLGQAYNRGDLSVEARAHVMFALGIIGHKDADATLQLGMQDESADVRLQAATAWLEIRGQNSAVPAVALVTDANVLVRRKAAGVAGFFKESSARVALERVVLEDDDPVVRRNAAWALGQIGNTASRDVLDQASRDASSLVRATARAAKGQLR